LAADSRWRPCCSPRSALGASRRQSASVRWRENTHASRTTTSSYDERDWLERFYGAAATQALDLLGKADEHGLPGQDYDAQRYTSSDKGDAWRPKITWSFLANAAR
jgi:hypothetical protein